MNGLAPSACMTLKNDQVGDAISDKGFGLGIAEGDRAM